MLPTHDACVPHDVDHALEAAEHRCRDAGKKLTEIRRLVLSLMLQARRDGEGPSKAYDLMTKLGDTGAAKPPTVYRALDFLLELKLIHKIQTLNAYVPCGHWDHDHQPVFLICKECGRVEEIHAPMTANALKQEAAPAYFTPVATTLEIIGQCRDCPPGSRPVAPDDARIRSELVS